MPASFYSTVTTKNQASHLPLCNTARFLHINELTVGVSETLSRAHRLCCLYVDMCPHICRHMDKADDLFRKSTTGKKAIANTTDSIGGGSGTGSAQDQKAQLVIADCDVRLVIRAM